MNLIKLKKSKGKQRTFSFIEQIKYTYNFQNFGTINTFGRDIYNGTITLGW